MSLRNKALSSINQSDLQLLIDDKVMEGKEYEYKIALPGTSESDKKEFLADVSSFANSIGGDLIYGIEEAEGVPIRIAALQNVNVDSEILRLENLMRDGIAPRIPGIAIQAVTVTAGTVLVVRIPRSWSSPHMVTFGGSSKFYARNSAGKYPLDVNELRAAFTMSSTAVDLARAFRLDRIAKLVSENTPVKVSTDALYVLHVIPLASLYPTKQLGAASLQQAADPLMYALKDHAVVNVHRPNLDGLLFYGMNRSGQILDRSYVQLFRNGIIEFVDAISENTSDNARLITGTLVENQTNHVLNAFLAFQEQLGFLPPVAVMLSLLNVRDYIVTPGGNRNFAFMARHNHELTPIDRSELVFPEILVDNHDADLFKVMRPILDMVWNACGILASPNYDAAGNWTLDSKR